MWQLYQQPAVSTDFGWTVYGPLLLMVIMFALTVPIWVSLGFTAIALLMAIWWMTEALPLEKRKPCKDSSHQVAPASS